MIDLPRELEQKLTVYRAKRRAETGKVVQRRTALLELLAKSLDGVEPSRPLAERLSELERRVTELEGN